ncbi:MAG TPA: hypothetical protein VK959_11015, partial [Methylophilaceae bacterium]|nr:hypothetical protein [Methylophilaceae bacterium]
IFKEHVAVATRGAHYTDRLLPVKHLSEIFTNKPAPLLAFKRGAHFTDLLNSVKKNLLRSFFFAASPLKRAAHFTDHFYSVKRETKICFPLVLGRR